MSLFSSDTEYIVSSEAVEELMFFSQLLRSIKIPMKLQVMVRIGNIGTIYMASNITTSCTKHTSIRYKYINENVKDRVVNNDILTKNLSAELHEKHFKKMVGRSFEDFLRLKNI